MLRNHWTTDLKQLMNTFISWFIQEQMEFPSNFCLKFNSKHDFNGMHDESISLRNVDVEHIFCTHVQKGDVTVMIQWCDVSLHTLS